VPRDRSDYAASISDSWKLQTLLNIIRLRYGDLPVFVEIAQVIAGYPLQTTVAGSFTAQNYITTAGGGPAAVTSRRLRPRSATTPRWTNQPWQRDSSPTTSGKPGAVQVILDAWWSVSYAKGACD
jgi:hypothetical protein